MIVLDLLLIFVLPFAFSGLILRVKSWWGARRGPSFFQPWWDFRRLLGKGSVVSQTSVGFVSLAPSFALAAQLGAALLVPWSMAAGTYSFAGDIFAFLGLLALARFLAILAALDTGSSFCGMGAARDAAFTAPLEPAFLLLAAAGSLLAGWDRLAALAGYGSEPFWILVWSLCCFLALLVEGCRLPVDDPSTHLELTMVHEVMVLDLSGPDLALCQYAASLRMVIFASLAAAPFLPVELPPLFRALLLVPAVLLQALALGLLESLMARLRLSHVPQFVLYPLAFAVLAASLLAGGGMR